MFFSSEQEPIPSSLAFLASNVCVYVRIPLSQHRGNANLNAESHPSAYAMNVVVKRRYCSSLAHQTRERSTREVLADKAEVIRKEDRKKGISTIVPREHLSLLHLLVRNGDMNDILVSLLRHCVLHERSHRPDSSGLILRPCNGEDLKRADDGDQTAAPPRQSRKANVRAYFIEVSRYWGRDSATCSPRGGGKAVYFP